MLFLGMFIWNLMRLFQGWHDKVFNEPGSLWRVQGMLFLLGVLAASLFIGLLRLRRWFVPLLFVSTTLLFLGGVFLIWQTNLSTHLGSNLIAISSALIFPGLYLIYVFNHRDRFAK